MSTTETIALPSLNPTSGHERYRFLDYLRGIAILGILPANIPLFAIPVSAQYPHWATDSGWREPFAYYFTKLFVDYKFISIFSLLFGVGLALIHGRCMRARRPFRLLYLRRILVLAGFAALHIGLLWYGDILWYYACYGFIAMWMANWRPAALKWVGIALVLVPTAVLLLVGGALLGVQDVPAVADFLSVMDEASARPQQPPHAFAEMGLVEQIQNFGPGLETTVYRTGGFLEIMGVRIMTWAFGLVIMVLYFSWRVLGLFMIGMYLLKTEWFLNPQDHPGRFRRMGVIGFATGIPLQTTGVYLAIFGTGEHAAVWLTECCHYTGSLGMTMGYVTVVAWLYVRARRGRWLERMAAVGRCALSCYILETVLCVSIFYAFGLGLYGTMDRLQLWSVVLAVWVVVMMFARLWLSRFQYGPLEWVWRRLTYRHAIGMSDRSA